jgi:epsilon-lactone hydrolase
MSLRAELVRLGIRAFIRRGNHHWNVEEWRHGLHAMEKWIPSPPAGTQTTQAEVDGRPLWRIVTPASRPDRHVLYLHGGGYISGAPSHYRHFTWRIANATQACVWVLGYRLAPEHPFPAALVDALAAYRWLLANGVEASKLAIIGDSAGGGLALGLLLRLRDERDPLPAAAVAISPWTDLALMSPSLASNAAADPMLNAADLPKLANLYLAGHDPHMPYASPVYGDTTGLPPTLIHVGSDEILCDDAVRMADKMRRDGCHAEIEVWPRMPHCWHLFAPVMPESGRAIARVGDFVQRMVASAGTRRPAAVAGPSAAFADT